MNWKQVGLRTAVIGCILAGIGFCDYKYRTEIDQLKYRLSCMPTKEIQYQTKVKVLYRGIYKQHLEEVIDKTLVYLGVPNRTAWTRLLLLTAMAESDCGRYLKQVKGPAKGIMQTEKPTERDILRWTKQKYPELYKKIEKLRVPAHLEVHETQYNLAYSIACAYMEYLHKKVNPVGKDLKQLAEIHKKYYNTYLGKATISNTMSKSYDVHNPWLLTEK